MKTIGNMKKITYLIRRIDMNLHTVKLNEEDIQLLIDDPEICPEESLHILISKIFHKINKPLHRHDLEYMIVNMGYFQAHNKEIPLIPSRSLSPILRQERGIWKISDDIYGLSEWQNNDLENIPNEEVDGAEQSIHQDSGIISNIFEGPDIEEKSCPSCDRKIDIKRHFCKYCGIDLSGFCSNCLSRIDDNSIFCADCGLKLESRVEKSN